MIRLPLLTKLHVENYGLFPGTKAQLGISWTFEPGLCLIAGVNGLGKTTLVTMLLRAFTGPYDLTGDGLPDQLESITPEAPVLLRSRHIRFFAQRVADRAEKALLTVCATFGADEVRIHRRLSDLRLLSFSLNGSEKDLGSNREDREAAFQQEICRLFELSSFVDVLLILHHVVFFKENRPGALWDENAQRHVLRALFLDKALAAQVATMERRVQSFDSQARNIRAHTVAGLSERLNATRAAQAGSTGKSVELAAEQARLDAELLERERLEGALSELDEERKGARREYERAKLFREEAERAVESLKFAVLARLFPNMEDAARLAFLKVLNSGECALCGADARKRAKALQADLAKGICPICGSEPVQQDRIVPSHEVENKRVARAREIAQLARTEEDSNRKAFDQAIANYEGALDQLSALKAAIHERTLHAKQLRAEMPPEADDIIHLERSLEIAIRSQRQAESERASATRQLSALLESGRSAIEKQTRKLESSFGQNVSTMIAEDAQLVRIEGEARLTQGGKGTFRVPAFKARMTAANVPGKSLRNSPDDVSESQRELIDLAFRLALIEVATGGADATLAMETPEASLDELAMGRVGSLLHKFASSRKNRLVVTSNLTNTMMIGAMFGGKAKRQSDTEARRSHVLNLLEVAAPNHAVIKDGAKYRKILMNALAGS